MHICQAKKTHTLVFLVGPTATGKTKLSLELAKKWSASILNCDTIQMYKGLDIGSAKPSIKERTKKPPPFYYFFDMWQPPFVCTAGLFRKEALTILKRELACRPVIAVGGSGFYIQALEQGMLPVKEVPTVLQKLVRETHKKKGLPYLYQWLVDLDPMYAKKISAKDSYRIFRAICLILSEKKNLSIIQTNFERNKKKLPYPILKIGLYLSKSDLLDKVHIRTRAMLEQGLVAETQSLLNKGLRAWPVMKSIGYKESVLFLNKQITKDELHDRIVRRTMRLAKKQMVWFKRDPNIHWCLSNETGFHQVNHLMQAHLNKGH